MEIISIVILEIVESQKSKIIMPVLILYDFYKSFIRILELYKFFKKIVQHELIE